MDIHDRVNFICPTGSKNKSQIGHRLIPALLFAQYPLWKHLHEIFNQFSRTSWKIHKNLSSLSRKWALPLFYGIYVIALTNSINYGKKYNTSLLLSNEVKNLQCFLFGTTKLLMRFLLKNLWGSIPMMAVQSFPLLPYLCSDGTSMLNHLWTIFYLY